MKQRILLALFEASTAGIERGELFLLLKLKKTDRFYFTAALQELTDSGEMVTTDGRLKLGQTVTYVEGEITRISGGFAFASSGEGEGAQNYFIVGRDLNTAMPGDRVLLRKSGESRGELPEAKVEKVIARSPKGFTGVVVQNGSALAIQPDQMPVLVNLEKGGTSRAQVGDKVYARMTYWGEKGAASVAKIQKVYGSSLNASACAAALLDTMDIPTFFPRPVLDQAEAIEAAGISPADLAGRTDLREKPIFTIDGAGAKDLDDAIHLEKTADGYLLGIHIADVSHYVVAETALDGEAFRRGTSVYFADQVIPMLPEALSNGICSLTQGVDRLAFSAFLTLDNDGQLVTYRFEKTVIRSVCKGIYEEANAMLDQRAGGEIREKYKLVADQLVEMQKLSKKRQILRTKRGCVDIETTEAQVITNENGVAVDLVERERGSCERMIEEFMLLANQAAAALATKAKIPFVYRVHEAPLPAKIDQLATSLMVLGLRTAPFSGEFTHKTMQEIVDASRGTPLAQVVNYRILRTMAKARYDQKPLGHFGLALADYTHFTSPIRRYPDLVIHRILTAYLTKKSPEILGKQFGAFAELAAKQASERELAAMTAERDCEDCYFAEYMRPQLGQTFPGQIVGFSSKGMFVRLANTVEGRLDQKSLPRGEYVVEGQLRLREVHTKKVFTIGDPISVTLVKADVSTGQIDFVPEGYAALPARLEKNRPDRKKTPGKKEIPGKKAPALRGRSGQSQVTKRGGGSKRKP